ncbi:alanine--tRNA ligase [Candidatus Daviesbacteria bacterium]|nr:alanine--tRNA ligase [Candidatus Daviesbacteria bacterium]
MKSSDIRKKYLEFFQKRGHKIIPSSSLVPENDPTTLFTGSGMQPMIPYLLGEPHPEGKRIVDSQVAFRSQDIEEVGDNRHDTLFEMLGNWSLGDYFKKEQLSWYFEFLTKELNLDPSKIYVSVFIGDEKNKLPKDIESAKIWKELFSKKGIEAKDFEFGSMEDAAKMGMKDVRIFYYDALKNWWSRVGEPENMPAGEPGGPDSEVFYDFGLEHDPKYGKYCHPNCDCSRFVEIGNSVFMQYIKQSDGSFKELPHKNVDFGGGLERTLMAVNNEPDMFKNDLHFPIIEKLIKDTGNEYGKDAKATSAFRIVADHLKAATFLIKNGVTPSNKQQGYVLRRLLRRSAVKLSDYDLDFVDTLANLSGVVIDIYQGTDYFGKDDNENIKKVIIDELEKFEKTIKHGLKEIEKIEKITGKVAFYFYQTFGFPLEITAEVAKEKGQEINFKEFEEEYKLHQELSRTTSAGTFKGGLADAKEQTTKLHTANHLMQAALRQILGEHVRQHGSNITAERLRYDFSHDQKLSDAEIKKVENLVNEQIKKDLKVWFDIEDRDQAIKDGALTNVGESYPDKAKVYKIGTLPSHPDESTISESLFSKELCGGPHVEHTGVIGKFKILKQESLGAGLKRIYATIDKI